MVTGRNVEVPAHFRAYVAEKLTRLERYDPTLHLFDVELTHERNRRQAKSCQRVEITGRGKGPVVRSEACADSFYAALEAAIDKLEGRLPTRFPRTPTGARAASSGSRSTRPSR